MWMICPPKTLFIGDFRLPRATFDEGNEVRPGVVLPNQKHPVRPTNCIHFGRISKQMAGWLWGVGRVGPAIENPLSTKGLVILNSRLGSNGTVPWHPWPARGVGMITWYNHRKAIKSHKLRYSPHKYTVVRCCKLYVITLTPLAPGIATVQWKP